MLGPTSQGGNMTRTDITLAALVALFTHPIAQAAPATPGASGTVFVTERQFGTVTAYDSSSGDALWTAPVGASPIGIVQPHGTDDVYTSDEGPDQMTVLDRRTGAWI